MRMGAARQARGAVREATERSLIVSRDHRAAWIALAAVAVTLVIGLVAIGQLAGTLETTMVQARVSGVRTRVALLDVLYEARGETEALRALKETFDDARQYHTSRLVVFDATGTALETGSDLEPQGGEVPTRWPANWLDVGLVQLDGSATTVADAVRAREGASGFIELDGERWLIAIGVARKAPFALATMTPWSSILTEIRRTTRPWWLALCSMALVLVPAPILFVQLGWRRRLRRELRERQGLASSAAWLSSAFQGLPAVAWAQDRDGRVIAQSELAVARFGRLAGTTLAESGAPEAFLERWSRALDTALASARAPNDRDTPAVEFDDERELDGERRVERTRVAPVRSDGLDGAIVGVIAVSFDVTREFENELELEAVLRRLGAFVEHAPIAAFERDARQNICAWTKGAEQAFGCKASEARGRTLAELRIAPPGETAEPASTAARPPTEREARAPAIQRHVGADGRTMFFAWNSVALRDADGRTTSTLSFVQDVTALQHARWLNSMQGQALRWILERRGLRGIVTSVLEHLTQIVPDARAGVLLLDADRVHLRAQLPSQLGADFDRALDGLELGPHAGSFGASAWSRQRVVSVDTQLDAVWGPLRELCDRFTIRAAWSQPVLSSTGETLGILSLYFTRERQPLQAEIEVLEAAANLSGIAIENARAAEQRQSWLERTAALNGIARAILDTASLEGCANAAIERVMGQLRCARVSVTLLRPEVELDLLLAVTTKTPTSVVAGPLPSQARVQRELRAQLEAGEPVEIPDLAAIAEELGSLPQLRAEGLRSCVLAPILRQGQLLGTLNVSREQPGHLDPRDLGFLQEVADILAVALDRQRMREHEQRLLARLAIVNRIGREILEVGTVHGVAAAAIDRVHEFMDCAVASVVVVDLARDSGELLAVSERATHELATGLRLPIAELGIGPLANLQRNEPWSIVDLSTQHALAPLQQRLHGAGVRGLTCVPLLARGELVGTLNIGLARTGELDLEELDFVRQVADLLAVGIHQSELNARLHAQTEIEHGLSGRLATLHQIGAAVLHARTLNELLESAIESVRDAFGTLHTGVALFDEPAGATRPSSLCVLHVELPRRAVPPRLSTLARDELAGLAHGTAHVIEDVLDASLLDPSLTSFAEDGVRSLALVPLVVQGHLIGTLDLGSSRAGRPASSDLEFAREIAALLAVGVQHLGLHEKLLRNSEELEQRVAERTLELTEVNEELESYVRTVSHDLRAPLRAVQGLGTAIREDYGQRLGSEGREFLGRMIAAAERMDRMLLDLLAYSRIGRTEMTLHPVALADAVAEARNQVGADLAERHALLDVDEPLGTVLGHGPTLVHALANLLTNATKFTPRARQPLIHVRFESRARAGRLWIEDNGIGIASEHHDRIFRPFERLHGADQYAGTGIGLALVRRALERMGGRTGVESRPGEGSRFWVELPRMEHSA